MSSKWFWGILIIFFVGGIVAGLLYFRYKNLTSKHVSSELAPRDRTLDSLVITHSKPNPYQKEYLRTSLLNKLKIKDFGLEDIEVNGVKKPILNLEVAFNYQGNDRKLTISFIDTVFFRKLTPQGIEDEGVISVANLNLEKEKTVNVGLSYIPVGNSTTKKDLNVFCTETSNEICLNYLEFGFGEKPIDFSTYFEEILANEDAVNINNKVLIPSSLYLLAN